MSENYAGMSLEVYASELASEKPAPGGGGTAAYVGALAAALGRMVGCLTVGKKKYAAVEERMLEEMEKAKALKDRLVELVDEDPKAFVPLSKAYGLPRGTEEEIAKRNEVLEGCLKDAAGVPLEILRSLGELSDSIAFFAENGSALAVSDAGCAAALLEAAAKSALLNVLINTRLMKDAETAAAIAAEAEELEEKCGAAGREIYAAVLGRLK